MVKNDTEVKASHILVDTEQEAISLKKKFYQVKHLKDVAAEHSKWPSGARGGGF